ncbi:MAG TPA: hypothetical protein VLM91_25335 [Candidatus Methylomirabilis sp.]|nr:hypothetical protein [Candidatus Methylomirabilis sp.]
MLPFDAQGSGRQRYLHAAIKFTLEGSPETFRRETIGPAERYARRPGLAVTNPETFVRVLYEVDLQTIVAEMNSVKRKR